MKIPKLVFIAPDENANNVRLFLDGVEIICLTDVTITAQVSGAVKLHITGYPKGMLTNTKLVDVLKEIKEE